MLLSEKQIINLLKGKIVEFKHPQIAGSDIVSVKSIHPLNLKKLHTAHRLKKGARITLSDEEILGSGFKDWISKAWKAVKGVVNSDVYQKYARPVVKQLVGAVPLPAPARAIADEIGKQTGAWGFHSMCKRCQKKHDEMGGSFRNISS